MFAGRSPLPARFSDDFGSIACVVLTIGVRETQKIVWQKRRVPFALSSQTRPHWLFTRAVR
jgi:hypothetical protein